MPRGCLSFTPGGVQLRLTEDWNAENSEQMNTTNQKMCAWSGLVFLVLFFIGLWPLAHFLPPLRPSASAAEIAAIYRNNATMIRLGAVVMMLGAAFQAPFAAAISVQLKRIEGRFPTMAYTQLAAGAIGVLVVTVPQLIFITAAFRPERSPELTLLLNDFGWLMFVMPFGPALIQSLAIGLAIVSDESAEPVFPRWAGFFNIWVAALYVPGGLAAFFKTGPFAWNGLVTFWIPAAIFGAWFLIMLSMLLKAIDSQAAELRMARHHS